MRSIEDIRASDAAAKRCWLTGEDERHPHGRSGHRQILPREITSNCWDTAKGMHAYSEWGNACGFTVDAGGRV